MTTGDEEAESLVDNLFREVDDQFKDLEREYHQARADLADVETGRPVDPLEASNERFEIMSEVASLRAQASRQRDELDERDRMLSELGDRIAGFETDLANRDAVVEELRLANVQVVEERREQARLAALLDARAAEREELAEVAHRIQNERDNVQDLLTTALERFEQVDAVRIDMDNKLRHLEAARDTTAREHDARAHELIESRAEMSRLSDQIDDLTRSLTAATDRGDKAEALAERRANEASYLNRRIEAMTAKVGEADGLNDELSSLRRERTLADRRITELERELAAQQAELNASTAAVEAIAARSSEHDELKARITQLEVERDEAWKAASGSLASIPPAPDPEPVQAAADSAELASLADRARELGARRANEATAPPTEPAPSAPAAPVEAVTPVEAVDAPAAEGATPASFVADPAPAAPEPPAVPVEAAVTEPAPAAPAPLAVPVEAAVTEPAPAAPAVPVEAVVAEPAPAAPEPPAAPVEAAVPEPAPEPTPEHPAEEAVPAATPAAPAEAVGVDLDSTDLSDLVDADLFDADGDGLRDLDVADTDAIDSDLATLVESAETDPGGTPSATDMIDTDLASAEQADVIEFDGTNLDAPAAPAPLADAIPVIDDTPPAIVPAEAPSLEVPSLEVPGLEVPSVATPSVETASVKTAPIDVPVIEAPSIEPPNIEAPRIEAPRIVAPQIEVPATEATALEQIGDASIPQLDVPAANPADPADPIATAAAAAEATAIEPSDTPALDAAGLDASASGGGAATAESLEELPPPPPAPALAIPAMGTPTPIVRKRTILPASLVPNTPEAVAYLLNQPGVTAIIDARSTCGRTGLRPSELFDRVAALRDRFDVPVEVVVTPVSTPVGGAPDLPAIGVHHVTGADTVADRIRGLCMGFPPDQPLVVIAGDDHVRRAAIGEEANVIEPSSVLSVASD